MDEVSDTSADSEIEYIAPAIVDYGTLVEVTAANTHNNLQRRADGPAQIGGFSG